MRRAVQNGDCLPSEMKGEAWLQYLTGGAGGSLFKENLTEHYRKEDIRNDERRTAERIMELYETLVYGGAKGRGWVPEEQRFYHDEVIAQTSRPSNYWREWLGQQQNGGSNVDPSTLGHNIFWSNYIGPWNPKDFNGDWNYDAAPKNAADLNAFIHDKGYDRFRAEGLGGVLLDRRVISIDERFISGQWQVMTGRGYSLTERFQAGVSGAFIDGATMPKRTVHIVKEIEYGFNGFINNLISSWMRGYR
jgi:hypothetical protein